MSFDDHLRKTLDRALTGVRGHLERDFRALAEELARIASEERVRAVREAAEQGAAEVRRQALEQLAQLREATQKHTDELRRTAEAEINELKAALDQARHGAGQRAEAAKRDVESEIAELRQSSEARIADIQAAADRRVAELQRELEAVRKAAVADAEDLIVARLAASASENAQRVADAVERARTDSHQAALAQAARLAHAVRSLDEARSLGDVLAALAESAGREVDRAAVFVVREGRLKGWRLSGFGPAAPLAKSLDLAIEEAGLPGAVVATGRSVSRPAVESTPGEPQPALPPFAPDAGPRHATALPVTVGGTVVGVLYADAPRSETPSADSRWPAVLDVLTRHASRVLEAMTVEQAAGISLPRPVVRSSHASLPGPIEHTGRGADEDAARRCARLLLSEIRMFNEPLVDAGRRSRDLLSRLSGEIERARRIYEARVPAAVRARAEYFDQELVRTLADGDRSLLGSAQ